MEKDNRAPDRKYIFPNKEMIEAEKKRNAPDDRAPREPQRGKGQAAPKGPAKNRQNPQ